MFTTFFVAMLVLPVIYAYITPPRLITPEEADEMQEEA
jgi:cobalt-zinc-cadmium resistance protein CzcA